jgi:hypothetical protein
MKKIILMLALSAWAVAGFGQNYLDVLRPFRGMEGRSAAESGVIPAAYGGSNALTGNPAVLSYVDKAFLGFDISLDQVRGNSIYNNTIWDQTKSSGLRFNSLTYVHPVRVFRGAWVWAVNIHPVRSYSSSSQFSDMDPDGDFNYRKSVEEQGDLYAYTIGTAFLATMHTSLGMSFSVLNGHNESSRVWGESDPLDLYTFDTYVDSLHFEPEYWGVSARVGLSTELTDLLHLGASVEFPSRISITEKSSHYEADFNDDGTTTVYTDEDRADLDYAVWGPWRLGVGLGFVNRPLSASINYRYHSYATIGFVGNLENPDTGEDIRTQIDGEVDDYIQNVNEFSVSLEWDLRPITLSVAGSMMNDPLTYHLNNILRLDTGLSYQFASGLGFTMAYRSEQWQTGLDHETDAGDARSIDVENLFSKIQLGFKYTF